ncbi:AAA family ATPase [Sanguibacter sp. 25GB23B1]|uniref:helix-turn-helix transcriptional regulator n=1 Tax=unclassified Sanguibacter TaxID=2645534 RepID=UPI0032AFD36B
MTASATSPALIGREANLAALRSLLDETLAGSPRAVVVSGEAGIGKTRLIREFADSAGVLVLTGQCVDLGPVGAPYAPLAGILRGLVAAVGTDTVRRAAGPGRSALGVLLPEIGVEDPGADRDLNHVHEAISTLLENIAAGTPLLVVVEDLQWADDSTLTVLRFLLRALTTGHLMVLLSFRSDDVPRGHPLRGFLTGLERDRRLVRHEVRRLTLDEVQQQACAILGSPASARVVEHVYERSEGVPFFVEELLGLEIEGDGLYLPTTLRELLLARYERLSEPTQAFLRLVAVGGVRVSHELLTAVFTGGPAALDTAAREAVTANVLVVDDESYTFRHALVAEAIGTDLLPGERARFHTLFAEALENGVGPQDRASEIAYHWLSAHNAPRAFPATLVAMDAARASFAFATAVHMGEQALDLWDQVPDPEHVAGRTRHELLAATASVLRNAGDGERSVAMIDLAIADCPREPPAQYAALLREKAHYLANVGRPGSVPLLEEALALVPDAREPDDATDQDPGCSPRDGSLHAKILASLAGRLMIEGQLERAIEVATRALDASRAAGATRHMSIAVNLRGVSRISDGQVPEGFADLEHARVLAGDDPNALLRYRVNSSDVLYLTGRHEEALRVAEEGLAHARDLGVERTSGVILSSNAVDPLLALGQWDRAEALIDRTLALEAPRAFSLYLRRAKLWLALWRGDVDGTHEMYRTFRGVMSTLSEVEVQTRLGVARVAGEMFLALDDLSSAWSHVNMLAVEDRATAPGYDLPLLTLAARILAGIRASGPSALVPVEATRDPDGHERALRARLARMSTWPSHGLWSALFEAEVSGPHGTGQDVSAWREAVRMLDEPAGHAHLRAYSRQRLAEAMLASPDAEQALDVLRSALALSTALGAGLVTRRIEEVAAAAGLTLTGPGAPDRTAAGTVVPGRRSTADITALTQRERQVLGLLGQGLTNRQIGDRLFITAKTASVHVSAILRKLGASSRTEAVYLARGTGAAQPERVDA